VSTDAPELIERAIHDFLEEVPALAPLKGVFQVDLQGRGDMQQFRVEMPGAKVTKGADPQAKITVAMRRDFFNAMVENGAKLADWDEAFRYGQAKATGIDQYIKLIANVAEKAQERQRLKRARH
jgi:hypothetical protein